MRDKKREYVAQSTFIVAKNFALKSIKANSTTTKVDWAKFIFLLIAIFVLEINRHGK